MQRKEKEDGERGKGWFPCWMSSAKFIEYPRRSDSHIG